MHLGEILVMEEKDPETLFKQTPSLILNTFELCQAHNLTPNYQIKRLIKKHNHLLSQVLLNKKIIKPFIFNTLKNTNSEKHLRLMHEVGILGLILPEYGRAHCKVSYDFYHRYTADEHSLRMVRFLEELENKPTEFKELAIIYEQLHSKNLLKLSTFIQPIEENKNFDGSNEKLKKPFTGNQIHRLKSQGMQNYQLPSQ